jgi:hypothetical protein
MAGQYLEIQREEAQGEEGLVDEEAPVGQLIDKPITHK